MKKHLLAVFDGVPQFTFPKLILEGVKAIDLLTEKAAVFPSKGEMRKLVQSGGVSINKEKLENQDEIWIAQSFSTTNIYWFKKARKITYLLIAE
jgi:tyrosyl-tRNA synthetase